MFSSTVYSCSRVYNSLWEAIEWCGTGDSQIRYSCSSSWAVMSVKIFSLFCFLNCLAPCYEAVPFPLWKLPLHSLLAFLEWEGKINILPGNGKIAGGVWSVLQCMWRRRAFGSMAQNPLWEINTKAIRSSPRYLFLGWVLLVVKYTECNSVSVQYVLLLIF